MSTASNNIYNSPIESNLENRFYVYLHIDPRNNEVFYVGKGCNKSRDNRAYNFLKQTRSTYHYNKLNKLHKKLKYSKSDIVHIYKDNLSEQCAFCLERILISKYGRKDLNKGTLLNLTDGGDGVSGRDPWNKGKTNVYTKEQLKNISKSQKERFKTEDMWNKGKQFSEESKQRMSKSSCKYLYWYFDEKGNKIEFINLLQFCEDNNLNYGSLARYIGWNKPYKGVQYYRQLLIKFENNV